MKYYAGLDVSLKEISVCVVDADGEVHLRGSVISEPQAIADFLSDAGVSPDLIVHESGMLSIWLQRGMIKLGLPATCIDARIARMRKGWRNWHEQDGSHRFMFAAKMRIDYAH